MRQFATLLLLALPFTAAAVPLEFQHQGRLFDGFGAPLDGTNDVHFELYETTAGGTALWTEDHTGVDFDSGYYNVLVGSDKPLDAAWFDGDPLYLAMSINGGALFANRLELVSVPYAVTAGNVMGGIVDVSEIRIDGDKVLDSTGFTAVTLDGLGCTTGQMAEFDGTDWNCVASAHTHGAADIVSGKLDIGLLPTGTLSGTVAKGDHTHAEIAANTGRLDDLAGEIAVSSGLVTLSGGLLVGDVSTCDTDGTLAFDGVSLKVCSGGDWIRLGLGPVGSVAANPAGNCEEIYKSDTASADGLYWVDINGGSPSDAFEVYCDMTTDGGGWTLVAVNGENDNYVMTTAAMGNPTKIRRTNPGVNTVHKFDDATINALKSVTGAAIGIRIHEETKSMNKFGQGDCVWETDSRDPASDACNYVTGTYTASPSWSGPYTDFWYSGGLPSFSAGNCGDASGWPRMGIYSSEYGGSGNTNSYYHLGSCGTKSWGTLWVR